MLAKWLHRIPLDSTFALVSLILLGRLQITYCQAGGGRIPPSDDVLQAVQDELATITDFFANDIANQFSSCIRDPKKDWNDAFNFSSDLGFVSNCILQTNGDLITRLCTKAEIKFYLNSLYSNKEITFFNPNKNCNLTSWLPGCEPGWACRIGQDQKTSPTDAADHMPSRTIDCRTCCEGFFCPHSITCMIPCPLGAYCPLSKINGSTGVCDPYNYQLPPGSLNHTCGGADIWAGIDKSREIFCPAGYYCPSTIQKISCSSGHYCRLGSTAENRCFRKSSCKPNSGNQDISLIGVLLIVVLSLLLLIIYNFSGQILTNRERRLAKSREAAAVMAREAAHARERWKAAKEIVKKQSKGLQMQLSRTFSRRKSLKQQDSLPMLGRSHESSETSTSNFPEPNKFSKIIHSTEVDTDGVEGYNLEVGGKKKKNVSEGKHRHTRTEIFKYAYGQLEKEKNVQQENKDLTFSGVVTVAIDNKIRTRPLLEISFKDLTLSLGSKRLLRSITGKLMPGRVSAVMGPSGAGKTTFLNALAGKATGCNVTGMVLINGKIAPIRSYKKIIGFVPQDDIVHGNLTVEENLWFSAHCRLSADTSQPDKVLVVERVIESLGLQAVRNSLVGTVEKRGISGGQRKRVNVGLEMVMEPSLLILDEPTSGLDSSSSQLLLRALRHEALEGVNICMVVHQPSYALFKMFDDLILLAKGGLIVYQGSVKQVEEYFSGLGINVPERVNPPDYFIDILEGIIKPSTSMNITSKHLPLSWMLHNGYDVPQDMQDDLNEIDAPSRTSEPSSSRPGLNEQSVSGDLWGSAICTLEQEPDHVSYDVSKLKDLSNRRTPGILVQYKYYLGRVTKQRLREAKAQGIDFLILGLAGICLGTIAGVNDESIGADGYTYTIIAVSLLCQIGSLKSFSLERLQYWRERESGMSSLAYFLSRDTIDHVNTVIKPIVYLLMFYFFTNPRSSIADNYVVLIALVYCVTGIGYTFAICFQSGSAQLWSALFPVVLTLLATQGSTPQLLANLCYPKWALEAFIIINAERYSGAWLITRCGILHKRRYDINHWGLCIAILFLYGVVFRIIAFISMVLLQKKTR
ncbi:ABC transporter G family member 28-like isoform X1 [Typha angustifolia]|uniref:ABC transporter G family member 28-like isoform X1 n=1 Tax=Typha angustifolia TaxID=59011 RepID=UPI003C2BAA17